MYLKSHAKVMQKRKNYTKETNDVTVAKPRLPAISLFSSPSLPVLEESAVLLLPFCPLFSPLFQ